MFLLSCGAASAQNDIKKTVLQELYQLQKRYSSEAGLSVDLKYTYSGESKPEVILDSLSGEIQFFGNGYRLKIEQTETIKNDKYAIVLFGEDSLMYISASKNTSSDPFSPTAMIDSSILNAEDARYAITNNENLKYLIITYPDASPYKTIRFVIDKHTGLLVKSIMVLRTEFLTSTNGATVELQGYEAYAIVETSFSNYKKENKKDASIDETLFFTRSGKEFIPTEKYRNYKIFIGTPNL